MNRIDRLSAILVQLQSRSLVKAQHIADSFGISLRTVYRDIRSLEQTGIPIIGNPGIGYSMMDGFKLPPLMFTQAEALAFLTAEKLVGELTDSGSNACYKLGMDKIRAVMRLADKDALENMEKRMNVLKTSKSNGAKTDNTLQVLLQSIHQQKPLKITYFTDYKQETSVREIEPIGAFFSRTNWYLAAFCRTRESYRTFRVDRIQEVLVLENGFTKQHPPLSDFMEEMCQKQELQEVVVKLRKEKTAMMDDDKYYHGLFSEKEVNNSVEYSFLIFSLDKFARWYLSFADVATILKPESLKDKVRELLGNISV